MACPPERKAFLGLGSVVHRTSPGFLYMAKSGSVFDEERKEEGREYMSIKYYGHIMGLGWHNEHL